MAETMFAEVREEAGIDENYRPLSGLAVGGFVVSWLSVAAFFGAVLWSVAVLAVALNVAALRHVAVTSRKGAGLARTGLAISILMLTAAVSYDWAQGFVSRRQAQRVADDWMAAVLSGDMRRHHQLSLPPVRRLADADRLEALYAESPALAKDLKAYHQLETVRKLREGNREGSAASLDSISHNSDALREYVVFRYELRYDDENGERKTVPLVVELARDRMYSPFMPGWRVNLNTPLEPPTEPLAHGDGH